MQLIPVDRSVPTIPIPDHWARFNDLRFEAKGWQNEMVVIYRLSDFLIPTIDCDLFVGKGFVTAFTATEVYAVGKLFLRHHPSLRLVSFGHQNYDEIVDQIGLYAVTETTIGNQYLALIDVDSLSAALCAFPIEVMGDQPMVKP